jgi:uncharacterized membrane protein YagU involved in acid resistance
MNTAERIAVGTTAGVLATIPMTALMVLLHRQLPRREQYPLPPRRVTMEAAQDVGLADKLAEPERLGLTMLSHFAYGGAVGAIYGALPTQIAQMSPASRGMMYGLAVWTGSYLGWLPLAGWHPPATQEPALRNALMIAAHLVFGSALGIMTDKLVTGSQPVRPNLRPDLRRATNAA